MILKARDDFALELARSVLLGDKDSDLEAGRAAGVGHNLKLRHDACAENDPDHLEFADLHATAAWLGRTFGQISPQE
jgi:D-glycero-D-manno-heptose 1,7-bisphosphate phosphatase